MTSRHEAWSGPVARGAIIATSFGLRFQGEGYFLTGMHRGASGAPVVARAALRQSGREDLSWLLLGVHTSRMDVDNRDVTAVLPTISRTGAPKK